MSLVDDLIRDEEDRAKAYDDATGKELKPGDTLRGNLTIAIGRNLTANGLSTAERRFLLTNDITRVEAELDHELPWWRDMSEPRQRALANMAFGLGLPRLLGFKQMLAALQAGDYPEAAAAALQSHWSTQVGERALRISELIRNG